MNTLRAVLHHPFTSIVIAAILVVTSLFEGWDSFIDELQGVDVGVHHGVLIYGMVALLKAIVEAIEVTGRTIEQVAED